MMTGTILILGGGFIGHALAKHLAEDGKPVTVVSRSAPKHLNKGVNWQQGDLGDPTFLKKNLSECRVVVHAASTSTPGHHVHTPGCEVEDNLLPLLRLLEIMGDFTHIPLIFLSSGGAIYGNPTSLPVSEKHLLAPLSNHAAGKAAAEHFLGAFSHQGHPVTILRPSNVYGPNQTLKSGFGIIRTILEHVKQSTPMTIWGNGEIIRDYLYIDDMIDACIAVLNNPADGTFNVGSGIGISINSLCSIAKRITGKPLNICHHPARSVDVKEIVLDNTAIQNQYSWQPRYTIEQGMLITWEWLHNRP